MSKIQVDPALFLALVRCYKLHHDVQRMGPDERKYWLEAHRLECVAEGKVAKSRTAKSPG